jgi:hypothetical protein
LKCYSRIALSESKSIKVLPMGSPPTSGAIETIHKNQSFKVLFSRQPVHEGRTKEILPRVEKPQTGTPQSLIFVETSSQATPNASKANLLKTRNECMSSKKNSSKAVKFDKCSQPLVLRCVSRLGVASQASFVRNERPQGKNERIQHTASLNV